MLLNTLKDFVCAFLFHIKLLIYRQAVITNIDARKSMKYFLRNLRRASKYISTQTISWL